MSDIRIYPVGMNEAEDISGYLMPEVETALKKGLPVTAYAAAYDGTIAGAIAGAIDNEVFEIWSLYVDPEYRRRGVGSALIHTLEKLVEDFGIEDQDDTFIPIRAKYTEENEDNEALLPFFRAMHYTEDPIPYPMYYIEYLDDLKSREDIPAKVSDKSDDIIMTFEEAGTRLLKAANHVSAQGGYPTPQGGLTSDSVIADLSFCAVRDGKIQAYVTIEDFGDDLIEVSSIWTGLDNPVELLAMLLKLIDALKARYPGDTKIAMLATNERAYKLIEYLFSYVKPRSHRFIKI